MTENAYIHIPFCVKKCNYCSFVSFNKLVQKEFYLEALFKEIRAGYNLEKLKTLYFGGGTPSLLTPAEVRRIMCLFRVDINGEVTFEVNPNRLEYDYLAGLRQAGVNRLSIGAQVFDDDMLKKIGRLHKSEDITLTVENAKKAGFKNISLDLIYGLPSQTVSDFETSLKRAVDLDVEHISLYGLKIEHGTVFFKNRPENLPDDDMQADMYLMAGEVLRNAGFEKYEISNFAKKGFESKHNLNYWDANSYYGFGCGAHGYEQGVRYENKRNLDGYIEDPTEKVVYKHLSEREKREEKIFLGLRKAVGINVKEIKENFGYDFEADKKAEIEKFVQSGHMIKTENGYAFTDEGFLLSNVILSELV